MSDHHVTDHLYSRLSIVAKQIATRTEEQLRGMGLPSELVAPVLRLAAEEFQSRSMLLKYLRKEAEP